MPVRPINRPIPPSLTWKSCLVALSMLIICVIGGELTVVEGKAVASTTLTKSEQKSDRTKQPDKTSPLPLSVIELNSKNFDSMVGDGNIWLVEFYTPWYVATCIYYFTLPGFNKGNVPPVHSTEICVPALITRRVEFETGHAGANIAEILRLLTKVSQCHSTRRQKKKSALEKSTAPPSGR